MDNIIFNKCQTPLEDLFVIDGKGNKIMFDKLSTEVQEQFWDFINNVPFIRRMVSPDRPLVSQLPRDDKGRALIDITNPPILENSEFFRQTARIYEETGKYINLRPNANPNSDYGKWLREERRRGWEGLVDPSTGMWVTGDYYWMLNYCPMHLVQKRSDGLRLRVTKHPAFWDGQFLASHYFYQSRLAGKHSAELAARGRGKTALGGAMLSKRWLLGETAANKEEVQCYVTAADKTKLMAPNQILTVFVDNIDFCAKNTPFAVGRLKNSSQDMLWKAGFKRSGSEVEYGSRNTVTGVITGVNQDKLNGSRGVLYIVEEAGIFRDLKSMYNMIRPSVEQGKDVFGQVALYGTAGEDASNFQDFQEMLYSPDGYNIYALDNVFDKEGQGRNKFAMFYAAYMNYDQSCMDENGNSDVTKALLNICYDRYLVKYNSSDVNTLTQRVSQYPVTPQEAILRSQGNMFPVTDLNERINQIDSNPTEYDDVYVGELVIATKEEDKKFISNGIAFVPTSDIPIRDYPTKNNKVKGALEIFEMPQKNSEGKVSAERYLLSSDPFDNDEADTMSLGSVFVLDLWTDRLVAEYTGRPQFADDFYEIARRMCLYYNGLCMFENNIKGMYGYFSKHNCSHLLAQTPDYLRDKQLITSIGYGNKSVGIRATVPIIKYGFRLIRDWLMKPVTKIEKDAEGNEIEIETPNLYNIRNRALLRELVQWEPMGNYDRTLSLVQLMLYREEKMILYQGNVIGGEKVKTGIAHDSYWDKNYPGKKQQYW